MKKIFSMGIIMLATLAIIQSCKEDSDGNPTPTPTKTTATVTTGAASNITETSANVAGEVTADGNATVTERGICWSTSANPTVSDNKVASGTGTGTFSASITGLTENTTYFAKAYAVNSEGTSYGAEMTFTTIAERTFTEGESYGGGIVFYVDNTGKHGLIVADTNLGVAGWGCQGTAINGAEGTSITAGEQNTKDILKDCSEAGIAAKKVSDLNYNGFSDWHLPSRDALLTIHTKFVSQGKTKLTKGTYWASNQNSNDKTGSAQTVDVGNTGNLKYESKGLSLSIKYLAIRAF